MEIRGWIFLLLSSSTAVLELHAAPHPRIFGNKNALRISATQESNLPEEELENLKKPHDSEKVTSVSKSNINSENSKRPENQETPLLSDNMNSLKLPNHNPFGIDETLLNKKSNTAFIGNGIEDPRVDYSPQDIAEYVFWTGDERGVADAISEFLQEGVVGKEDAVKFLDDVKGQLSAIRSRYSLAPRNYPPVLMEKSKYKKNSLEEPNQQIEEDYDEITEKLQKVDAKMREFALEKIIYHMAKSLFGENLMRNSESKQKISAFIEEQAEAGRIPKDLERDVLEILVEAFVDSVDEQVTRQSKVHKKLIS